ncbi:cytochrome P450 [Mangrovimicrobium sediminis]|uniref:Cytochrome P450 n=1 Tax=Mangrovimicrobium sediminis TaxID=2562682 RepID=A0A4Z0M401_9GAMM|nr:cytochrome P450 [Haliea sp. SAOS-164]TGD74170.1 cytochrome P450 [Haliea sp. SAOS-164]
MSTSANASSDAVYYDPYLREIARNPYPVYRRLRDEAPVYYNPEYDFYAVSHYDDVKAGFANHKTFISSRGGILELIKENVQMPPGTFIFEDPPLHTVHRTIVQRMFMPRRMINLESKVRELTANCLDQLVGRDDFDFIADIGAQIPMRVIGMLLGIPEEDLQIVRESTDSRLRTEEGKPLDYGGQLAMDASFEQYIDWRIDNPSDDVITELMGVEFEDETGTRRTLTREELLTFVNVLAGAGNETTNRLIGWTAKTLADHPDQRRELAADPSLIPDAIEEVLRYEPVGTHVGRYLAADFEFQGQTVPAGSAILLLVGSANRDERHFPDPDRFDIHRERRSPHLTFGFGIHTCIGNVLARMEGRVVYEELLKRIPEWEIDVDNAELSSTSTVRGWETLPAYLNGKKPTRSAAPAATLVTGEAPDSVAGEWQVTIKSPTGPMATTLVLEESADGVLSGSQSGEGTTTPIESASYSDGSISWTNKITKPMKMKLDFTGQVSGGEMTGKVKAGFMGKFNFTGVKLS